MTRRRAAFSSVSDPLLVIQLVRLFGAVAIVVVPVLVGDAQPALVPLALAYLIVVGAIEIVRRRHPDRAGLLLSGTVLIDGLVVSIAVAITGGYGSPLLFLVYLDVVAITLLASYRTGLKVAIWCALLLLLAHTAADAGFVDLDTPVSGRVALVRALTFLVFALATAAFSAVGERTLRHSREQLQTLVDLSGELERAHRADDVIGVFVHHACTRLGFARSAVLLNREGEWSGVVGDATASALFTASDRPAPLVWELWDGSGPLLVRELDDALLDSVIPGARNVVIAPVAADDEPIGVALGEWAGSDTTHMPMLTVAAFAQSAAHTALALRNAALLDEVEHLATRDGLTGLANRRLFQESLERESARARRLGAPVSVLLLDVDHFKQVNDSYGHPAGDVVLRTVADVLSGSTKSFDVPARYGGDEFVVLLPGCVAEDAIQVAERVRHQIAVEVGEVPITVSVGVATMPDNASTGERLIAAADAALYLAKREGRDRVCASGREGESAPAPTAAPPALHWQAPLAHGA